MKSFVEQLLNSR